ncbi:MAG TPA: GNAT family protein [Mycobacteriales bacterium]|nr:GNAT family protein [Mycobacteriales bacterium]
MTAPGWPASLRHGQVGLRPLRWRDASAWVEVRVRNERWLGPWEGRPESSPESSWVERNSAAVFASMLRASRREARAGRSLPFALTFEGRLVGQVTVSTVVRGAFDSASVGYWVDERVAGRGVVPTALALVADHCFREVGLHRLEACVRPENAASLRVVRKLGFREEGLHRRYLFIDGDWRDHLCFTLLREEVSRGVLRRWLVEQDQSQQSQE